MTDAELVAASRRGEHAAFGHLVERYQGVVCAVSYSSTGDRVLSEDVAQETFIAAWRQLDQLRETRRLRSWLCGIARNLGRKARRKSGREQLVDEPSAAADDASPFEATSAAEAESLVRDALTRVPETYREVLVLYYRENRSAKEVADTLGISEAAVLQRLARGRQYLADGVSDLVERSLESLRPRPGLAAGVLAAIPAVGVPRVVPATHGGTATMIKLALVAVAVAATGTTAYVVTRHDSTPTAHVATAPAPSAEPARSATLPIPPAQHHATPPPATAQVKPLPAMGANAVEVPSPDDLPLLDRATIERTNLYRGPTRGPADAPVTIVVFTDLMCTHCGQVLGTIDQLWDEYRGKLRLVVKQFPVHKAAVLAAEAALAANAQGKFWELHDLMLANQTDLSHDALIDYARQVGLDVDQFRAALDNHTFADAVKADQDAGTAIDVMATPSFVINGKRYTGALPIEEFRAAIDEALANPAP